VSKSQLAYQACTQPGPAARSMHACTPPPPNHLLITVAPRPSQPPAHAAHPAACFHFGTGAICKEASGSFAAALAGAFARTSNSVGGTGTSAGAGGGGPPIDVDVDFNLGSP
jgi:hypothetical protein